MNRLFLQFMTLMVAVCSVISVTASIAQTQTIQAIPFTQIKSAAVITPAKVIEPKKPEPKPDQKPVVDATDKTVKPEEKKADPAAERLAKIEKQIFDRKPSTILRVWSMESGVIQPKPKTGATTDPATAHLPPEILAQVEAAKARSSVSDTAATDQVAVKKTSEDPFEKELDALGRNVSLGRWVKVAEQLKKLPPKEGQTAWRTIVKTLGAGQQVVSGAIALVKSSGASTIPVDNSSQQSSMMMQRVMYNNNFIMNDPETMALMQGRGGSAELNLMTANDFIALTKATPQAVEPEDREPLARLVLLVDRQTDATEELVRQIRAIVEQKDPKPVLTKRDAALILMAANLAADIGAFLPSVESTEAKSDPVILNLLARHALAKYNRFGTPELVNQAWAALQRVVALEVKTAEQSQAREEATKQALALVSKVDKALTRKWFEDSFKGQPERGAALLASLGESASSNLQLSIRSSEPRLRNIQMLKTAVDALLATAPERADQWRESLTTLASAWLAEAKMTKQFDRSGGPRIQRDMYGNVFYSSDDETQVNMQMNPNMPQAVPAREMVRLAPQGGWLERVDSGMRPNIHKALAELYLKIGGDSEAFPHIEQIATTEPEMGRELAQEFLKVWTTNHDMNQAKNQRNPYIFMFGFEQKAESIPLTRSKQERNLQELAGWLIRLRKLPIRPVDESLIAKAFTTCHSSAEVYRMETIASVFGPIETLSPETIARLAQQMRQNLAGLWRRPAVQDQAKTKRREKDIKDEVLRGYSTAQKVVDEARLKYPDEWSLTAAKAALLHDENNFQQEIALSPDFTPTRRKALALFAQAAEQYVGIANGLPVDRQTNDVFDQWFFAGLGACEPAQITETTVAEAGQPGLIREALRKLPGAAADMHLNRFANQLFTRMSAIGPAVKFRYLKAGFEIVGDVPQAYEARKVYDYYKDLNKEIQLDALVDGPTTIDASQPFGVYVNIRHTREIERESGGFGKYLQNQNAGNNFYYNYGRPLENYRDKFQEAASKALQEHFEVLSVTFETEKVTSHPSPEKGWRSTPYAYLLLKSKSSKVDRIPSLKLDLDFMDTSGYVILPVESPPVAVNCNSEKSTPRPFKDVHITQILDERQSGDGRLILEIKTTGHGLMPPVGEILDINAIPSFDVDKIDDQGLAVSRFDEDSSLAGIISERTTLVTLKAVSGLTSLPSQIQFPRPKVDNPKIIYQKYVDADLVSAEALTTLIARYGQIDRTSQYLTIAGLVASLIIVGITVPKLLRSFSRKPSVRHEAPPADPFALLGLLRGLERDKNLSESLRTELSMAIRSVEEAYFGSDVDSPRAVPDLQSMAVRWSGLGQG